MKVEEDEELRSRTRDEEEVAEGEEEVVGEE